MVSTRHSCCSSHGASGLWPVLCWHLNIDTQMIQMNCCTRGWFGKKEPKKTQRSYLPLCVCYHTLQWLRPLKRSLPAEDQWHFALLSFFDRQLGSLLKMKMSHKSNGVLYFISLTNTGKLWSSWGLWIQKRALSWVIPALLTGTVATTLPYWPVPI